MKILDLGCGTAKTQGAVGVNIVRLEGVDLVTDLSSLPFPFADNTFDAIYLNDVIEHLPNTIATMEEIYRISRPEARIHVRVVNWNSHYTAMDPTHLHAFTENSFDFFGKRKGRSYYSKAKFEIAKIGYQYNELAEYFIKYRPLMKFFSFYLNNILEGLSFELCTVKDQESPIYVEDWTHIYSVLRCPYCLGRRLKTGEGDQGKLFNINDQWLVCHEEDCNRKYPIVDGTPIIFLDEGEKWAKIKETLLPLPPKGKYPLISTGELTGASDEARSEFNEDMSFEEFAKWAIIRFEEINKRFKFYINIVLCVLLCGVIILVLQKIIGR